MKWFPKSTIIVFGLYTGAQFKSDLRQSEKRKVGVRRVDGRGFSDGTYQTATLHSSGKVSASRQRNEDSTFNVYLSLCVYGYVLVYIIVDH